VLSVNSGSDKTIRATDAKEVGVENPAEETFCRPNHMLNSKKANCGQASRSENLKCSRRLRIWMGNALPTFKTYTVDEWLRQFRKVDRNKPSIEFVDFDSKEGRKLLEEYRASLGQSEWNDQKL